MLPFSFKGNLAYCGCCKMSQNPSRCKGWWFLRTYAEGVGRPQENVHLSVFSDLLYKLQNYCELPSTMSEDQLVEGILMSGSVNLIDVTITLINLLMLKLLMFKYRTDCLSLIHISVTRLSLDLKI